MNIRIYVYIVYKYISVVRVFQFAFGYAFESLDKYFLHQMHKCENIREYLCIHICECLCVWV